MSDRTLMVWANGSMWVLRNEQIDVALAIGKDAENPAEAWDNLIEFCREEA